MKKKIRVAALSELTEGEGLQVEIKGEAVALYRCGESVRAIADACPHMGAPLSDGYVDGETVVCPWHGWAFDLNTGRSPFDDEACVAVFTAVVEEGEVFVEVEMAESVLSDDARTGS